MANGTLVGLGQQGTPAYGNNLEYQVEMMRNQTTHANQDRRLKHACERLAKALMNNDSSEIQKIYDQYRSTYKNTIYYELLKAQKGGDVRDEDLRLALADTFNCTINPSGEAGKDLDDIIDDNQSNNFWSGYWNAIVPGFQDKSRSQVKDILYNEDNHKAGDKVSKGIGYAAGIATWAGAGAAIGSVVPGVGTAVGAVAGTVCGLVSSAISWFCS